MKRGAVLLLCIVLGVLLNMSAAGADGFEKDTLQTSAGDVEVTFLGHGTLMLTFAGKTIHVDPYSKVADYSTLPKADIILLTHHHRDHLDESALNMVRTKTTALVVTEKCAEKIPGQIVMDNGDSKKIDGIPVRAVPAYNLVHKRENGEFFHPKGEGNGYVLTFGETRVYIAGDTENTPEMKRLAGIDYAFLPMNLPYTMTPEMVADAARAFRPRVLYPYHYGETDPEALVALLKDEQGIEIRIRSMR